jgi:hypothetical protein
MFAYILIFQSKFRVLGQMPNISRRPGNEIIHRQHFPPFRKQPVTQMRSQKSRSTRDYRTHSSSKDIDSTVYLAVLRLTTAPSQATMRPRS